MSGVSNHFELVNVTLGPGSRSKKTIATHSSDTVVDLPIPVWSQTRSDMLQGQNDIVDGEPSVQHQETTSCEIPEIDYPVLHISNGDFSFGSNGLSQIGFDIQSSIANIVNEIEATACTYISQQKVSTGSPIPNVVSETGASGVESTRAERSMVDVVDIDAISKSCVSLGEEQSTSSKVASNKVSSPCVVEMNDDNDFVCEPGASSTSTKKRIEKPLILFKNKKLKKENDLSGSVRQRSRAPLKKGKLWRMLQDPDTPTKLDVEPKSKKPRLSLSTSSIQEVDNIQTKVIQDGVVNDFFKMFAELMENKNRLQRLVQEQEVQLERDTEMCNDDEKEVKRLKKLLAQHESRSRKNLEKREKSARSLLKVREEYDKHINDCDNILKKFEEIAKKSM